MAWAIFRKTYFEFNTEEVIDITSRGTFLGFILSSTISKDELLHKIRKDTGLPLEKLQEAFPNKAVYFDNGKEERISEVYDNLDLCKHLYDSEFRNRNGINYFVSKGFSTIYGFVDSEYFIREVTDEN